MISIQGIERVGLTRRIDEIRQRITNIENNFGTGGIGGDFQATLEKEIARQEEMIKKLQPIQEIDSLQKISRPVNENEIANAAKVAEALKAADISTAVQAPQINSSSKIFTLGKFAGEEAFPNYEGYKNFNPVAENPTAAISPETEDDIYTQTPAPDDDVLVGGLAEDFFEDAYYYEDEPEEIPAAPYYGSTEEIIEASAIRNGVDPKLAKSIAIAESNMNQSAVSGVGAIGVMQLMPETARGLGVNPYDEAENIEGGTRFLRQLLDRFGGNVQLAVAAYNAGPGAVQKYGGVPPYRETQNYVGRVMDLYAN